MIIAHILLAALMVTMLALFFRFNHIEKVEDPFMTGLVTLFCGAGIFLNLWAVSLYIPHL